MKTSMPLPSSRLFTRLASMLFELTNTTRSAEVESMVTPYYSSYMETPDAGCPEFQLNAIRPFERESIDRVQNSPPAKDLRSRGRERSERGGL
jgi:hypothetical protein